MSNRPASPVWWLHPAWCVLMTVVPVTALALWLPAESYRGYWRTFRFVDWSVIALSMVSLAGLLGGLAAAMQIKRPSTFPQSFSSELLVATLVERHLRPLLFWYRLTFTLTLAGYISWFGAAWSRGLSFDELQNVLLRRDNAIYALKDYYFQTIPGVTTLTQFGMAFMTIAALLGLGGRWRQVRWAMLVVVALGYLRAYFLSERLAIIELVVPPVALICSQRTATWQAQSGLLRHVLNAAPAIAAFLLVAFFASAEFFRSWVVLAGNTESSLFEFSLLRLTGYYVTALNNSMYLMGVCGASNIFPGLTLDWLYRFPVLGQVFQLDSQLRSLERDGNFSILQNGANPEFTNTGGLLVPLIDYGWIGGFLFWLAVGFVIGRVWRSLLDQRLPGLLMYPMMFIGLLEIVRIPYLFLGRSIPSLILLAWVAFTYSGSWWKRHRRLQTLLGFGTRVPADGPA